MAVLHITHNMSEALAADRVIVLDKGVIYREGRPLEILTDRDAMTAVGLEIPPVLRLVGELKKQGWPVEVSRSEAAMAQAIVDGIRS